MGAHPQPGRAFWIVGPLFVVGALLVGCGGATIPPLREAPALPDAPADIAASRSPEDQRTLSRISRDLTDLYGECVRTRELLTGDVDEAEAADVALGIGATAATVAGTAASSTAPQTQEPDIQQNPRQGTGKSVAATSETEAKERVEAINAALEYLDDFVVAHPDPIQWTAAELSEWQLLLRQARGECRP
ncbi:MAG: hypothetical protein KC416_05600 [Myxococcales bacterium]|nr:hypothetical protein [Myxococcales bacterium]